MTLDILPGRTGSAAENMAADFLLLKRYTKCAARAAAAGAKPVLPARFRHYGWRRPAFTLGYSQKIASVRAQLPADADDELEVCRRPTGGGVMDHRDDWAYALVIPRGHILYDAPAPESYRIVQACIAEALIALGEKVILQKAESVQLDEESALGKKADADDDARPPDSFARPERYDVVRADNGVKVAGAAQKRTKEGLLFQGSLARAAVTAGVDWDAFECGLIERLANALALEAEETPWPEFAEHEVEGLVEQYAAAEWTTFR